MVGGGGGRRGRQATAEKSGKQRKTAGDGGGRRGTTGTTQFCPSWSLSFSYRANSGKDGMTECRPSSSLIHTCRATLENDRTGRQNVVRPRPGSGRTDCPVANTGRQKLSTMTDGLGLWDAYSTTLGRIKERVRRKRGLEWPP